MRKVDSNPVILESSLESVFHFTEGVLVSLIRSYVGDEEFIQGGAKPGSSRRIQGNDPGPPYRPI